jgi:DNA-binding MarR family transcriptional regulator
MSAGENRFPPLSTSLESFADAQSERVLRKLIYSFYSLSAIVLRNREHFGAYIGVTGPQFMLMTLVADNPDSTVKHLAEQLSVSTAFVAAEIGKLIKKNILEKTPNEADGRSMLLNLTSRGRSLLRESNILRRRTNDVMFQSLTVDRAKALQETISAIVSDARRALHELESPHLRGKRSPLADQAS